MSRTKKGAKSPGYEYQGKRPMSSFSPCKAVKKVIHKIERQRNKPKPKDMEP